ncbi:anthrone oxygenase family protein [Geodermatophilus amargosae]|uniref:anthrone oxygenase family protein n=1 Tax=Geodermatophilus amargosae TaxID=1296565 RepID=UPI0034E040BB
MAPVLTGAAAHLAGAVLVTAVANVPLDEELRRSVPGTPEGDAVRARHLRVWTRWNTVRAAACTAAAAALGSASFL